MKTITHITLIREVDPEPDLSWLESTMEDGRVISSCRYTNEDVEKYGEGAVEGWIEEDTDRLMSYGDQWVCLYLCAEATVVVDGIVQTLHSGGIGGVDSDSGDAYIEDIYRVEVGELRKQLKALGFSDEAIDTAPVKERGEPEFTTTTVAEYIEA